MQNRYVGDIGDYFKYGMLRRLAKGRRLGVMWYLFPNEDHNNDGGHLSYLDDPDTWRHYDPELYDALKQIIATRHRSVAAICQSGVLGDAKIAFESLDPSAISALRRREWRQEWFENALSYLKDCDLVFADPDNGLCRDEVFKPGQYKHWKRLPYRDASVIAEGRTAIIYHHNSMYKGGHEKEVADWLDRLGRNTIALRWRAYGSRSFFIINPTPEIVIEARKIADDWGAKAEFYSRENTKISPNLDADVSECFPNKMINSEKTTVQQSALYVSRVKGCLYGGALGDALGYPVEFKSLTSIQNDYGPDGITAPVKTNGEFVVSDDTQMTLFTLEGLTRGLRTGGNVAEEIRLSYIDWLATQSPQEIGWQPRGSIYHDKVLWHLRAPGNTCLSASRAGAHGTLSDPINDSKGCGGVMRVAPVGLVTVWTADEAFDMGCAVAAMTHGHPSGYLSAGALAFIIRTVMDGSELREATENAIEKLEAISGGQETTSALSNVLSLAEDTTRDPSDAVAQLGEGWVGEEALAIGLYSALKANSFSNAVIVAANHDGDSDSTASIAGQIHGAIYGYDALPSDWIAALDVGPMLDDLSGLLLQTVESE